MPELIQIELLKRAFSDPDTAAELVHIVARKSKSKGKGKAKIKGGTLAGIILAVVVVIIILIIIYLLYRRRQKRLAAQSYPVDATGH